MQTVEYQAWVNMIARTRRHPIYIRRGIDVCDCWLSFENFAADMGQRPSPKHELDRIDNNLGYSPNNCRWATRTEQMRNTSANRQVTYQSKTQSVAQWADDLAVGRQMLINRLDRGWSVEDALGKPPIFRRV